MYGMKPQFVVAVFAYLCDYVISVFVCGKYGGAE